MFIKNQSFNDEETLMEQLFDFGLGNPSEAIRTMILDIDREVLANKAFNDYRATLTDEEDIMELDAEERLIRLAERLMGIYASFTVDRNKLSGIDASGVPTLLYEVDLY